MIRYAKVTISIALVGTLLGCTANSKQFHLSNEQAQANRDNTTRLQQADRDRDHIERMRRADAISRATRNVKGGVTYSPSRTTILVPR